MPRNETSRLVISVDINKATGQIQKLTHQLGQMEAKTVRASQATDKLKTSVQQTGDKAAASAVGFQTMTQGMLNLSTTSIQTWTSLTNLASAEHRVSLAQVASARGADLLANKRIRLNELEKNGLKGTAKWIQMSREVATATADMTVKDEKLRIEKAKLNDVWLLFGANMANVSVSMYQTMFAMNQQFNAVKRLKVAMAGLGIQTATFGKIGRGMLPNISGATAAFKKMTFSVKGLSFGFKGLYLAMGPIGIAMIGITTAMAFFWPEIEKVSREALGLTDQMSKVEQELQDGREATEGFDKALGDLSDTATFKIPNSLYEATLMLQKYTDEAEKATKQQAEFNAEMGITAEGVKKKASGSGSGSWQLLPQAFADTGTATTPSGIAPSLFASHLATTTFDKRAFLHERGYITEDMTDEGVNMAIRNEVELPFLRQMQNKDFFLKVMEEKEQQKTMARTEWGMISKEGQIDAEMLLLKAMLDEKEQEWYGSLSHKTALGKKTLTSEEKKRLQISRGNFKNISGYRIHDGRSINIKHGAGGTLRSQTYASSVNDAPKDIMKNLVGNLSGNFKSDSPLVELLTTGKTGWSNERLAIFAQYGIDVGRGGTEFEAIMAKHFSSILGSRGDIMSKYMKDDIHSSRDAYMKALAGASEDGLPGTTPFQSKRAGLREMTLEEFNEANEMTRLLNVAMAGTLSGFGNVAKETLIKELGGMDNYERLGGSAFFKQFAGTSDFATGKGFEGVSATAAYQNVSVGTPSIIRDHGRRKVAMLNAQRGLGGASVSTIRGQAGRYGSLDQDLQEKLNENTQEWQKEFDKMEDDMNANIDSWRYMKRWANSIGIGTAETQRERDAQRMQTATGYASQLPTLTPSEAFKIIKDELQGEQTLIDMLAYQQRMEGMSTGVT